MFRIGACGMSTFTRRMITFTELAICFFARTRTTTGIAFAVAYSIDGTLAATEIRQTTVRITLVPSTQTFTTNNRFQNQNYKFKKTKKLKYN